MLLWSSFTLATNFLTPKYKATVIACICAEKPYKLPVFHLWFLVVTKLNFFFQFSVIFFLPEFFLMDSSASSSLCGKTG